MSEQVAMLGELVFTVLGISGTIVIYINAQFLRHEIHRLQATCAELAEENERLRNEDR